MNRFSVTEAALEGFRVTRERPTAVLWWWAAFVIADLIQFALGLAPPFRSLSDQMTALQAQSTVLQQNPGDAGTMAALVQGLGHVALPFLIFALVMLVSQVVLSTAVMRAVLRPSDRAFGYLRLSMDEARQLGLALVAFAATLIYAFLVSLASSIVLGLLAGLVGGAQPALLSGAAFVIVGVAFLYPAVRLSLAPAMTFADGRISFLRSWALSAGRFWPILGAYLIAVLLGLAVVLLGLVIEAAALAALSGRATPPPPDSLAHIASAGGVLALALNGLLGALFGAIVTAPAANAFSQLSGRVGAPSAPHTGEASPWV